MKINSVHAREILDSRGNPTVEVEISTKLGSFIGVSPSGASTGEHEAVEKRDGGSRYLGKGVKKSVQLINSKIAKSLIGKSCLNQKKLDELLCLIDGTDDKRKIGANGIVACSMAIARAGAASYKKPLYTHLNDIYSKLYGKKIAVKIPQGYFNVLNGGRHAANKLAFQEFMLVPSANSFAKQLQMVSEIYHHLQVLLIKKFPGQVIAVGDEGGFAPPLSKPEEALNLLVKAVEIAGYSKKVSFAMDVAASEFYSERKGRGKSSGEYRAHKMFNASSLMKYYISLCEKYNIVSIEDPFDENAFVDFASLRKLISQNSNLKKRKIQIVGDDLTCTNSLRVKVAVLEESCDCLLLKVNQIGTVTEAMQSAVLAQKNGWKVMVSHRSGETSDTFIADLAVGIGCGQIKSGSTARGERVAKYNQLLRIEERMKRR
ncbi:phosphopyruvate hydratase [archaeon]|jgi:enolase|nr:phosphopyruvate hydratase [archaeon]MBT6761777.1 phosphopyruvate hydratase [archaeon]